MENTPKIRFKGFTEDWEQRKLGECGETYTGLSGKTKEDFGHGDARFVTYMNVFSNPIADKDKVEAVEIDKSQNCVQYGDVFFTTSSETPEEVGMSCVWLENTDNTYLNSFCFGYRPTINIDPYFMAYVLRSNTVRKKIVFLAQGISRYNISKNKVMEIEIPLPTLEEQKLLGKYFDNLDNLITLQQRKYDKLVNVKKSMLEKMFPREGAKVPEIRFEGFTDDWEQRKLYEIADKAVDNRGKTPTISEDGTHPLLEVASLGNGTPDYSKVTKYLSDETFETELRAYIKEGDILFSTVGSIGLVSLMDANENAAIAQNIVAFRANEKYDSKFLYAMLSTEDNQYKAQRIVMGAVQPSIKVSQLVDVEYCVTENIDEQRKLGDFFIDLDNLITLHQRKCDDLKEVKKYMLQNMFPAK